MLGQLGLLAGFDHMPQSDPALVCILQHGRLCSEQHSRPFSSHTLVYRGQRSGQFIQLDRQHRARVCRSRNGLRTSGNGVPAWRAPVATELQLPTLNWTQQGQPGHKATWPLDNSGRHSFTPVGVESQHQHTCFYLTSFWSPGGNLLQPGEASTTLL